MTTTKATHKRTFTPLTGLAAILSVGSLIWTTVSLFDLLGAGPAGLSVALGADIVWGSVIYAEWRGVRVHGKRWPVTAFGWIALLAVAGFLVWHGLDRDSLAMAAAGPFLPLGAKVVWVLALAAMRDPAALTDEELHTLARMERGIAFEEAQHRIEMRRREMAAERQIAEVSTDFEIELMRQDQTRELTRRRPIAVAPHDAPGITSRITDAPHPQHQAEAHDAVTASQAPHHALPAYAHRSDAAGEVADRASDAPLTRVLPERPAAQRITDGAPRLDGLSKAAAVRVMRDAHPTASAPQLVERLAHHGIEASDAYVRTVLSRTKQRNATEGGYL